MRLILVLTLMTLALCLTYRFAYDAGRFDGHVEGFSKGLDDGYLLAKGERP